MKVLDLFVATSMPIVKVLFITALGSFIALDRVDILRQDSRIYLNKLVYFVFNPALVGSNLAQTVTYESLCTLCFMPLNVLITNLLGSALGWVLVKVTRAPRHLKGLIIGSCSAGNLGNLPIMLGNISGWSYAYNIVRISSLEFIEKRVFAAHIEASDKFDATTSESFVEPLLPTAKYYYSIVDAGNEDKAMVNQILKEDQSQGIVGTFNYCSDTWLYRWTIPALRYLLIGSDATLHVINDAVYMVGNTYSTEIFGTGESESSVILLCTYALAPVALTLWSTLFLWIVSS